MGKKGTTMSQTDVTAHDQEEADLRFQGEQIIEVLQLEVKPNGRVDTTRGDKTPVGLARTMRCILDMKY